MESPWIITLVSGSSPPLNGGLVGCEFADLELFTSRTVEDGRDRFRVHAGYFDDRESALCALEIVRESYPTAWALPAERYQRLVRCRVGSPPAQSILARTSVRPGPTLPAEAAREVLPDSQAVVVVEESPADDMSAAIEASPVEDTSIPAAADPLVCLVEPAARIQSRLQIEEWTPSATRSAAVAARPVPWYRRFGLATRRSAPIFESSRGTTPA